MSFSQQILERLLYENESEMLDFKSEQYLFGGATNDEKSELLKDILAFANTWRRANAYILIGVEEVQGGRSAVLGVTHHLDDAKLQQFVNSKTQRPVHFSYNASKLDGRDVGIIFIPLQERPIYLTKDFGKLKKETVYARRGSSTDIASPDEIVKMGQTSAVEDETAPLLQLEFFDGTNLLTLGNSIQIETVNLILPEDQEIPDYGSTRYGNLVLPDLTANKDYYRDVAHYLKKIYGYSHVDFRVINDGNIVAKDVNIEIIVKDTSGNLFFCESNDIPDEPPSTNRLAPYFPTCDVNPDIWVDRSRDSWIINAELGKIQPKAHAYTSSGLFIGSKTPTKLSMVAKVFADNLFLPKSYNLSIEIQTEIKSLSVEELISLIDDKFLNNNDVNNY